MKNISLKFLSLSVVVASFVSSIAFAEKGNSNLPLIDDGAVTLFEQLVKKYDENKDNVLSAKELAGSNKWAEVFDQVDLDADKVINKEEFAQYHTAQRNKVS